MLSRFSKWTAAALAAVVICSCASGPSSIPPVTAQMAATAGKSEAVLAEGRQIFAGPCTACHVPEPLGKYTPSEWAHYVEDMAERTRLNASQKAALLAYVMAARPVAISAATAAQ